MNTEKTEIKCSKCGIVVSELLAFVSNKVDTLPETAIIQICLSAYSSEEIEIARSIVYPLLVPTKKYLRRKEGSERKSLQEIIKHIKEFEPSSLPVFVAKNLNKLPPVTFDHIDVTTFLKEMAILKSDVADFKSSKQSGNVSTASSNDIISLRSDIDEIKKILTNLEPTREGILKNQLKSRSPRMSYSDKNTSRRTELSKVNSANSARRVSNEVEPIAAELINAKSPAAPSLPLSPSLQPSPPPSAPSVLDLTICVEPSGGGSKACTTDDISASTPSAVRVTMTKQNNADLGSKRLLSDVVKGNQQSLPKIPSTNTEGWVTVKNKTQRKNTNRRGKAEPLEQFNFRAVERTCALYVSRVHKETTSENIAGFIKYKTNIEATVTKINTFENDFNAFKIIVPLRDIDIFLSDKGDQFWPTDIVFRRYLERNRPRGQTNNTESHKK